MAVIPSPGGNVDTGLFPVAWRITYVADQFTHIGNSIKDTFLIGVWLSTPFLYIGGLLWGVAQGMISSNRLIGEWLNWVRFIIDGNGFINLLRWASWHFDQIRLDAGGWLKRILFLVDWWFGWFILNPTGWLNHFIRTISWAMGLFLDSPDNFINVMLRRVRFWLGQFLDNPRSFIVGLLSQVMPELWFFLTSPLAFLIHKIGQLLYDFNGFRINPGNWLIYRLSEFNNLLGELLRDPETFIKRRVSDMFQFPYYFWSNPQFFLLEQLLRKQRQYLNHFSNALKELFIDLILIFI